MPAKQLIVAGVVLGAAIAIWLFTSWQPARQIEKKMDRLLEVAGARHWGKAEKLISDSYLDAWGQDKQAALDSASEFGRHFLILHIAPGDRNAVEVQPDGAGFWRGNLVFSGRGTTIGEMMFSRAEELESDFVFVWRRESWKPWDWKLISTEQPDLQWIY